MSGGKIDSDKVADANSKLIESYAVTDASMHDSQMLEPLLDGSEGEVYADSAYRSAEAEAMLAEKQIISNETKTKKVKP